MRFIDLNVCVRLGLGLGLGSVALLAQSVTSLTNTGPRDDRINVVYLAEGYTAAESDAFLEQARRLDEYMRQDESWDRFSDWVNSFAVMVESAESGTDVPIGGGSKDTYFNTSFGGAGQEHLLAIQGDRSMVTDLLVATVPSYDVVVLLVNSPNYGGTGGFPVTISRHEDAGEILLHELGHSFAILADEYVVPDSREIMIAALDRANSSLSPERENLGWRDFVSPETELPTGGYSDAMPAPINMVGAFEGAVYRSTGVFRPTYDSKMRSLDQPFGPVNLKAFADRVHLLNLGSPSATPRIVKQPVSMIAEPGESAVLEIEVLSEGPTTFLWRKDGIYLPAARSSRLDIGVLEAADFGTYVAEVTNGAGTTNSLLTTIIRPGDELPPVILAEPQQTIGTVGEFTELQVSSSGSGELSYQWFRNGEAIAGANEFAIRLPQMEADDVGIYFVEVSNPWGAVRSTEVILAAAREPVIGEPQLVNFSARAEIDPVNHPMIIGTVWEGPGKSRMGFRGVGPTLSEHGVDGPLSDPQVKFRDEDRNLIAENNDLASAAPFAVIEPIRVQFGGFPLAEDSKDAMLLPEIPAGVYTLEMTSPDSTDIGVGLLEGYVVDVDGVRLTNLSVRGRVGLGEDALFVGFRIEGDGEQRVLLRAVGPGLEEFGVNDVVNDPRITIKGVSRNFSQYNRYWADDRVRGSAPRNFGNTIWLTGDSAPTTPVDDTGGGEPTTVVTPAVPTDSIVVVDVPVGGGGSDSPDEGNPTAVPVPESVWPSFNFGEAADDLADDEIPLFSSMVQSAGAASGAFPLQSSSRDAAIVTTLKPGLYTVTIDSADGQTGTVLFELYLLPPEE